MKKLLNLALILYVPLCIFIGVFLSMGLAIGLLGLLLFISTSLAFWPQPISALRGKPLSERERDTFGQLARSVHYRLFYLVFNLLNLIGTILILTNDFHLLDL